MQYVAYEVRDAQCVGDPIVIEAADDAAAIDLAERFLNGVELQVWQADRLVVTPRTEIKPQRPATQASSRQRLAGHRNLPADNLTQLEIKGSRTAGPS